jgi:uncharacterized protein YjiS (DUF1127 family)
MADKATCDELLEEYRMLRRRTEAVRQYDELTSEDLEQLGVTEADLNRLEEVRQKLDEECQQYLPAEDRVTIRRDNGMSS